MQKTGKYIQSDRFSITFTDTLIKNVKLSKKMAALRSRITGLECSHLYVHT